MNYSRKQLEAFGEPFGEACTRKEGGRIIYGGGGSPSTPDKTTQVSDLPDWAKPAAQRMLGKAEAITDIGQNPYQQYQGDRVAQFTPLQQQAFGSASQMDAGPQGFAQQVPGYMSPYIQNVINAEKLEAGRASQILGQQQQAQATQAGAFGGYREGIQRAERERGLRGQMGDIQTKGLQYAFDRAGDQFRSGITQGLAVNQNQAMLGGQQQQQVQNVLGQQYQDFQNQQRYPYQQLEFMSNILRGTPMGTVQTMYGSAPTGLQTLGGLGMGAYGLSQLFRAEGGPVSSYAGGGSVTDVEFVEGAVRRLSDAQLQQEMQDAAREQDQPRMQVLQAEATRRAQMRSGSAGISSLLSEQMADNIMPTEESMARGGIVAFAAGGGARDLHDWAARQIPSVAQSITDLSYTPMSDEAYNEAILKRRKALEEGAGPDIYAAQEKRMADMEGERDTNLRQGKGLAALQAAGAMLQGRGAVQGLGRAGSAFAGAYGQALAADRAEKKALANMQFNIADAQRKERMGLTRDSIAAAEQARKDHDAAQGFGLKKAEALGGFLTKTMTATRPVGGGDGAGDRPLKLPEQLAAAEVAYATNPSEANALRVNALRTAVKQTRSSDIGQGRVEMGAYTADTSRDRQVLEYVDNNKIIDPDWRAANRMPASTPEQKAVKADAVRAAEAKIAARAREMLGGQPPASAPEAAVPPPAVPRSAASAKPAATKASQVAPMPTREQDLKNGQVYQTARGPAQWDASKRQFFPVQ